MKGSDYMKIQRNPKGQFTQNNKSGGRKKIPDDIREMLAEATPKAIGMLIDTMNDPNAKIELRVACAEKIIDRVYGKALQPIDIDGGIDNTFRVEIEVIK